MDINKIRQIAKCLLDIKYEVNNDYPFIIYHPFLDAVMYDGHEMLTLQNNADRMRKIIEAKIDEADLTRLLMLMKTPYHLLFAKLIKDCLSVDEFSELLAYVWVNSENPNQDANVTIKEIVTMFKYCNPQKLMTDEDYKVYQNLPDKITIYRGIAVGRNPKGISYTDDKDKADWFAHRFDTGNKKGYVISKQVNKNKILAYFNVRGEKELVYN